MRSDPTGDRIESAVVIGEIFGVGQRSGDIRNAAFGGEPLHLRQHRLGDVGGEHAIHARPATPVVEALDRDRLRALGYAE